MIWNRGQVDLPPVQDFKLGRFLGKWYEIARFSHGFEQNLHNVEADYFIDHHSEHDLQIHSRGTRCGRTYRLDGRGKFKHSPEIGELTVNFNNGLFWHDYRIVYLSPGYDCAMVCSGPRRLWILGRRPFMSLHRLEPLREMAHASGFHVDELEYPYQGHAAASH